MISESRSVAWKWCTCIILLSVGHHNLAFIRALFPGRTEATAQENSAARPAHSKGRKMTLLQSLAVFRGHCAPRLPKPLPGKGKAEDQGLSWEHCAAK